MDEKRYICREIGCGEQFASKLAAHNHALLTAHAVEDTKEGVAV